MTGIGEALEELINELQVEGHELFRIFAEVQLAKAIQFAIVVIACLLGFLIPFFMVFGQKDENDDFDDLFPPAFVMGIMGLVITLIIAGLATSIYMHFNYPEYYAATELLNRLQYLTP